MKLDYLVPYSILWESVSIGSDDLDCLGVCDPKRISTA